MKNRYKFDTSADILEKLFEHSLNVKESLHIL